jgi:hypothetical protein
MVFSIFAIGGIVGRFVCGVALDRMPAHVVAAISMGLPSIGLVVLASGVGLLPAVAFSVFLMGLFQGAEGDLVAYLVGRYFKMEVFGTVLGLLIGSLGFAAAVGSMILSYTLRANDTFTVFLIFGGITVFIGGSLFMLLGKLPVSRRAA